MHSKVIIYYRGIDTQEEAVFSSFLPADRPSLNNPQEVILFFELASLATRFLYECLSAYTSYEQRKIERQDLSVRLNEVGFEIRSRIWTSGKREDEEEEEAPRTDSRHEKKIESGLLCQYARRQSGAATQNWEREGRKEGFSTLS